MHKNCSFKNAKRCKKLQKDAKSQKRGMALGNKMNNQKDNQEIYFDNAATAQADEKIIRETFQIAIDAFANPSSTHANGIVAKKILEESREKIAKILCCNSCEIIFTSGGTESINLAIQGICRALKNKGKHIITSKIEHPAVLNTCKYMETQGFEVTYLDVSKEGIVDVTEIKKSIRQDTILITIMHANNEIGTIQPIQKIAQIAREKNIYFHTDACQSAGTLDINVQNLGVDLMSINSSKLCGLRGAGILYVKKGVQILPLIFGGGQEFGLRSGTQNVAEIAGFAKALENAEFKKQKTAQKITLLRDKLISTILQKIPGAILNGHLTQRLPNNVSISIKGIDAEALVQLLSENKIFASTGSACTSQKIETSHVLRAIGQDEEIAHGAIRFTLSTKTTEQEINTVIQILPLLVDSLQKNQITLEPELIITNKRHK